MADYIETLGVVIKQNDVGEADRALTILTEHCGKIHVWVNGARRARSKYLASSQLFCASKFMIYKFRDTYRINTSEVVEAFFNLRTNLDKLSYAAYLVELTNDGVQEEDNEHARDIMRLLLNTLHFISNTEKDSLLMVHIFEIRFLSLIGFRPMLLEGSAEAGFGICPLSEGAMKAVEHIVSSPLEKIFSFEVESDILKELDRFCKIYVENHMGKEYKVLHFYAT